MGEPTPVWCIDCDRKLHTPMSRARRIGEGCWRKRKALERKLAAQATSATLPGMSGRGGRDAGHDGPTLLDDIDTVVHDGSVR